MGSRLFLPTGPVSEPYPFPKGEREELLNRLWRTRTLLPGAKTMPVEELRDYVQAQEAKEREGHYERVSPAKRTKPLSPQEYEQTVGALKEYLAWRRKKRQALGLRP